jgi:hypothetical protein
MDKAYLSDCEVQAVFQQESWSIMKNKCQASGKWACNSLAKSVITQWKLVVLANHTMSSKLLASATPTSFRTP